jgi:hypothetical protein
MKKDMLDYCHSIGLTEPFLERIKYLYKMVVEVIKEEPVEFLIEEYINGEGVRTYTDVSFFCENYWIEINQFLTDDKLLIHKIGQHVIAINIAKQDYDFKKATERSRLNVEIMCDNHFGGNYKASKENCDYLWTIICKYYIPLIKLR